MPAKPIILFFIFFAYYNDGLSQDTAKYYYPSGQLKLIQVKMDSSMLYEKEFYDNGQPMTDGYLKFIDGSYRLLNVKAFYNNGALRAIYSDTSYTMYEPSGKVYSHCQMQKGIKNGNSFNYINGLLMIQGHYKNGQKDGRQISYHMGSGKLSSEENYSNGKLEGPVKEYDTLGNISRTIVYKNGSVIKATYFDSTGKIIGTTDGQEYDKNRKQVENFSKEATNIK